MLYTNKDYIAELRNSIAYYHMHRLKASNLRDRVLIDHIIENLKESIAALS